MLLNACYLLYTKRGYWESFVGMRGLREHSHTPSGHKANLTWGIDLIPVV